MSSLTQDGKIAVASSVIVFIVTAILCFIFGFLCHHWCPGNFKEVKRKGANALDNLSQGPLYGNVVSSWHNSEALDLKENIAYGPVNAL